MVITSFKMNDATTKKDALSSGQFVSFLERNNVQDSYLTNIGLSPPKFIGYRIGHFLPDVKLSILVRNLGGNGPI